MKKNKLKKSQKGKYFLLASFFLSSALIFSCATNKTPSQEKVENQETTLEPEVEYTDDEIEDLEEVIYNEEYLRSVKDLDKTDDISVDDFTADKAAILKIIEELSVVMEEQNFEEWKTYITPASLEYYSKPVNLRKAQKKLPDKTIQLKGPRDYFRYVFIPSRQRAQVDEIRYTSKTDIRAVDVHDDDSLVVYYYFRKIDGKWLVNLPEIE